MTDPVVQPAMRVLPFHDGEFGWVRFESFCLAVVRALPEIVRAERYGKTGEKQRGIDIEADLVGGGKRTIQCRLRKQFSKKHVEKTVKDTTFVANEHEIWVTCDVGTAVSDYIDGLSDWSLRSREGISQTVRELERERARRIVEDAFGAAVRRGFLGPRGPIAFETPGDYFAESDTAGRLLRHDIPLVGRRSELDALLSSITSPGVRVVVQPGRGGIGKTRLLRAAADELKARGLGAVFARAGAELTMDAVDDLPLGELVVVVDDAHLPEIRLGPLFGLASRRGDAMTVVLGLRPAAVETVRAAAAQSGLDVCHLVVLEPLHALPDDDVEALAGAAMGGTSPQSGRLAQATGESPLVTVIGGTLLARGQLGPASASDEEFREAVLTRFSAEQLGMVTPRVAPASARRLATLVAALEPLNVADGNLMALFASELDVPLSEAQRWLGDLEDAGLVLSRGRLRRITPEVLADQLLREAYLDSRGRPTHFADELWTRFSARAGASLLTNLADLERQPVAQGSGLLDAIWAQIEDTFRRTDAWGREQLIETIRPAAFLLAPRALRVVRLALETPAEPTEWGRLDFRIDDASVRAKLPLLLRGAGHDANCAPTVLALLWELGRDDARPANAHPDHALRVLEELSGYHGGARHHDLLLDLVDRELLRPDVDEHHHSPLTLIGPLLVREGIATRSRGRTLELGSYAVDPLVTQHWRERVRGLLTRQALHGTPRQRVLAASLFHEALDLPHGYYGNPVDSAERDSWLEDELALVDAIETIEGGSDDHPVRQALSQAVEWHATHSPWPEVRQRVSDVLSRLAGPDEELIAAIADPWGLLDLDAQSEREARVATRLLASYPTGVSLATALERLLHDLTARGRGTSVGGILAKICCLSAEHATGIWSWALQHPNAVLTGNANVTLQELRRAGRDISQLFEQGWTSSDPVPRRCVAAYLSSGVWFEDPQAFELQALEESITDSDPVTRRLTTMALLRLRSVHPELATRLALLTPIRSDTDNDILFATVKDAGLARLEADDLDRLAEQLVRVPELKHFANELLGLLAQVDWPRVLDIWLRRLKWPDDDGDNYTAVPFHDFAVDMLPQANPKSRRLMLRGLLSHVGELEHSGQRQLGVLFWRLAIPGLCDTDAYPVDLLAARAATIAEALEALRTSFLSDNGSDPDAASVLDAMPWQVLLDRYSWTHDLLETTGGSRQQVLVQGLHTAAFGGISDDARLVRTEQAAQEAAVHLPPGSKSREFFADLADICRRQNEAERRRAEEDHGAWR